MDFSTEYYFSSKNDVFLESINHCWHMIKIKSGFTGERAVILPESIIEEFKSTPIGKQLYITDIGFYPNAGSHFRERKAEEANQFILIYCVDGDGWYRLNNITSKVSSNQLFILPKKRAHAYGCHQKRTWTIYWIHFDGSLAPYLSESLDKTIYISPDSDSRINDRLKLFEEIFQTLKNGYNLQNIEFCSTALHYFLGSIKYLSTYRLANIAVKFPNEKNVTENAIHFMRENIHKKLSVKSMADYVGISTSHFSAVFQSKTGYPPLGYLTHLRIQEACHYLDFSDMKINQLSALVGYEDPLYFSRIFTKTMGMSPAMYRKKKKG